MLGGDENAEIPQILFEAERALLLEGNGPSSGLLSSGRFFARGLAFFTFF